MVPKIAGDRSDGEMSVMIRRSVKLQCDVSGVPSPEVTWTKDEIDVTEGRRVRLLEGGRVLHVVEALVEDAGAYVCTAQNVAGVDRRQFKLQVLGT